MNAIALATATEDDLSSLCLYLIILLFFLLPYLAYLIGSRSAIWHRSWYQAREEFIDDLKEQVNYHRAIAEDAGDDRQEATAAPPAPPLDTVRRKYHPHGDLPQA